MRLTLRTLLAYLDDTLDPAQAKEIGQKVAESHVAQELVDRIKKVTRRRGLAVPASGPDKIDANIVAEYLDNDLPSDKVAEIEEHALNADAVLAEIAACHQILALVLGEPAHVPPTARQRMYQLVKGRESIKNRRAARVGPAAYPGEAADAADLRAARRGLGYRLVGAVILGIALGVALWLAWPPGRPADTTTPTVADNNAKPADQPKDAPPADQPKVAPADQPADQPKVIPPVLPAVPAQPKDVPPAPAPRSVAKPSTERKEVGRFVSKDKALLHQARAGEPWERVPPDARVETAGTLLSLPGSASEVRLDSGPVLTLWGNLPDTANGSVLATAAVPHAPADGCDADFTLDRGRVYVAATKPGPAKVRARFADQAWDVTLDGEGSEVLLEAVSEVAGEPFRPDGPAAPPLTRVTLGVTRGKATVETPTQKFALVAPPGGGQGPLPAGLSWDSKAGLHKDPLTLTDAPAHWAKAPARSGPADRAREYAAAQKSLGQRLADKNKSVDLALAELADEPARSSKVLAAYCQGALGNLPPLVDALEDPGLNDLRVAAAVGLQHQIAREPGTGQTVLELLQEKKAYGDRQAEDALRLLRGFAGPATTDPATYEFLTATLRAERVGLRELAAWRLGQLDPDGAARINFAAGAPEPQRERGAAEWKRRIPDGKVPPGRGNGPQGRLPTPPPARG
jgi:hypothetical protein